MKKFIVALFFLFPVFLFSQDSTVVWFKFFNDSVKTYPYLYETPNKYIYTMEVTLGEIEKKGQTYLDWLGKEQLWFVPEELANQVEKIVKKNGLIVKHSRYWK